MSQLQLIELLSTGARQAFPLDELQAIKVRVGAVYSVVEADTSEAPEGLLLKRKEDTLEVEVDGEVVANLEGFYAEDASSSFLVEGAEGDTGSVVIGPDDVPQAENSNIVWEPESDSVNWGWYAGGGALAAAALAAGGGGGGGGNGDDSDTSPPTIVSGDGSDRILLTVDENTGAGQVIYTVTADEAATFSLKPGQGDVGSFSIGSGGQVILIDSPDFESQSRYEFVVVATNSAGNSSEQTVTLTVNNLAPAFNSGSEAFVNESGGADQLVYTAAVNEPATFSLAGDDADSFTISAIDETSAAVNLIESPDFDVQQEYEFTVVATDSTGESSEQNIILGVIDPNSTDITPPTITSGPVANDIDENSGPGQVVYTATANEAAIFELEGADADSFTINGDNQVILTDSPDFESQASYEFTIVATDAAGNRGEQEVSLAINDVPPTITSGAVAPAIDENSGANQVVYTAVATESPTFSLAGPDADSFSINANSGAVSLNESPDFEAQSSYRFTVVATDGGGEDRQAVTLAINNLPDTDTTPPAINSENTATSIDENSGSGQRVYTATANESATFSLGPGADQSDFSINPNTGAVFLTVNPDFETQNSYQFSVIAEDDAGNRSDPFAVTLQINDLDEIPPTITSDATATIDENSGANQVVYMAEANETASFSLAGVDAASFTINANSGAVALTDAPDFEAQPSYSFTIVAVDTSGNQSEPFAVTLAVNNLPPTITSGGVAPSIDENSGADQLVYTAVATETPTFSLAGTDAASFTINANTGAVFLKVNPDFETQSSYSFTVVASDGVASSQQAVTLAINDLDDIPPNIESGATAPAVDEGTPAGQVIYTAIANEEAEFSLAGIDAGSFDISPINETSASVTLLEPPDFDDQSSYSFVVVAEDAAGNIGQQPVTLAVNEVFDAGEIAPTAVMFDLAPDLADHSARSFSVTKDNSGAIETNSGDDNTSSGIGEIWADAGNLTAVDQANFVGSGSSSMGQSELPVPNFELVAEVSAGDMLSLPAQITPVTTSDLLTQTYKALSFSSSDGLSIYAGNGQATALWSGQADFYSALSNPSFGQSYSQTLPAYVTLPV